MSTPAPHFFISYSRDDAAQQRRIIAELRSRGINVWVDIENLIPGSPAWEREIERAIRSASGIIVLLSPDSNNSEWVRREISFAEQNAKRIFPVLIFGNEDASIPLRLSNHQRVDMRKDFRKGMDELADALRDHLGVTAISKRVKPKPGKLIKITSADLKKLALPGLFTIIGLACIGGLILGARWVYGALNDIPTRTATIPPDIDPIFTPTATPPIVLNNPPTGKIVFTCQVYEAQATEQICIMNADGSGVRQLTDQSTADHQDASLSPDGKTIVFVSNQTDSYEIFEMDLSGNTSRLTDLKSSLGYPEISPDNKWIVFSNRVNNESQIWRMDRNGENAKVIYKSAGNDALAPTWSPGSDEILFAVGKVKQEDRRLYVMGLDGNARLLSDQIITRGRTDWSINNLISLDMGERNLHDVYLVDADGSGLHRVSNGNNSQGASLSPDGKWIAFMAYTADPRQDASSCEIFIMRVDGKDRTQLTHNNYCDLQPRWGN